MHLSCWCSVHTLLYGCVEPSSYSSGYGQPTASHPGYQPPAHPVSQQYQTSTSQPASGSGKYPPGTIASPSAFSSFPPMSAGYGYQQPGSKPPALTAEQYAGYIRPQSLPRHHTPQSGNTGDCCHPSGYWSTAPHAVVLIITREHYYCVYLFMLCRVMLWCLLLIYTKHLPVSGLWVHDV